MKEPGILFYAAVIATSIILALVGLYLLANFSRVFSFIRNELLRKNVAAWLTIFCFIMATTPLNGELLRAILKYGWWTALVGEAKVGVTLHTLITYNAVRFVANSKPLQRRMSFAQHKALVLLVLVILVVAVNHGIQYLHHDLSMENFKYSLLISIYFAFATGIVYVFMSYRELDRQKKIDEKELELSRLRELKVKAELDALHSKVNPHFLYNALNSIADLAVTNGKKARRMTIALADLFRYSINYSHNNYTTVQDEIAMTEVYLEIEKIRFEDQLTYTVKLEKEAAGYLIPRFILQPIAENAVKHGLKATGKMTEIELEASIENGKLRMTISDTGPAFPDELLPGYGVKSVYDKLDLLFPGDYEVHFKNAPRKQVLIYIQKLIKNEPAV